MFVNAQRPSLGALTLFIRVNSRPFAVGLFPLFAVDFTFR
jgi:hypothetical protein